ncbi:MAG TPA: cyclodeaminase/cyclohydrolase family protein [Chloroflexia bacterium]|nr:cyclodeaminase/cyclohydrolase family protein [Chloroflexia bacterium]
MTAYVYLLHCADGSYYTGWTNDLARRVARHQRGQGARYTRARLPVALAYFETLADARAARQREYRLRHQSHAAKAALAGAHPPPAQLPGRVPGKDPVMSELTALSVTEFVDALASSTPTPGGGSASALAGAMGAAMVAMACNLTVGREKFAAVEAEMREVLAQATPLQATLIAAVDEDTRSYSAVSDAYKLPKASDVEKQARTAAIQQALQGASEVPLRVAQACAEVLTLTKIAQAKANPNVASDAYVAELLARAGRDGAIANVEINLSSITDTAFATRMREALAGLRES